MQRLAKGSAFGNRASRQPGVTRLKSNDSALAEGRGALSFGGAVLSLEHFCSAAWLKFTDQTA
jgi:hypothetical protein